MTPMYTRRLPCLLAGIMLWTVLGCVVGCDEKEKALTPGPPVLPSKDTFKAQIAGSDRPTLGPVRISGIQVRLFRRTSATGLIEVRNERVSDANAARRTQESLIQEGWTAWPPSPAPELAIGYPHLAKDSMDCGYLMQVTKRPTDWLRPPVRSIQCFSQLSLVEKALDREEQIVFHRERELWCAGRRSTFPHVKVPENRRCNVRALLFVGEDL